MEFSEVVRKRRMVRDFDPRPLPAESVQQILTNAQRGPSSGFTQGFEFLIFEGSEQTQRFWTAVPWWHEPFWDGAKWAPLLIVPFGQEAAYVNRYKEADKASIGRQSGADFPAPYWFIDTAFAAMLMLLTAVDAGLGAFYFSIGPTNKEIPLFRAALAIPDAYFPIGVIAIGYPAANEQPVPSSATRSRRRAAETVIHRGEW